LNFAVPIYWLSIAVGIVCADLAGWYTGARIPPLGIILHCHLQRLSSGHNDRTHVLFLAVFILILPFCLIWRLLPLALFALISPADTPVSAFLIITSPPIFYFLSFIGYMER
jgi:hypothetical protein